METVSTWKACEITSTIIISLKECISSYVYEAAHQESLEEKVQRKITLTQF